MLLPKKEKGVTFDTTFFQTPPPFVYFFFRVGGLIHYGCEELGGCTKRTYII